MAHDSGARAARPRPPTVLVLARSASGFYFGGQVAGVVREVAARGGRAVVVQTVDPNDHVDRLERLPSFDIPVARDEVDGAVVVSLSANARLIDQLRGESTPVVLTHAIPGVTAPIVQPDNAGATTAAVEHLIAHGHRRLAYVGHLQGGDFGERVEAFRVAVRDHGLADACHVLPTAEPTPQSAAEAVAALLALEPRPTAVVAATDGTAHGLLAGLAARGVRVPGDMAVVGHDDLAESRVSSPRLSSVSMRFHEVGALAGRMILDAVEGSPWPAHVHRPVTAPVARRASCGCTPDLLDLPGQGGPDAPGLPVDTAEIRRGLHDALHHGFAGRSATGGAHSTDDDSTVGTVDEIIDGVLAAVDRVVGADGTEEDARTVARGLRRLGSLPDLLHPAVAAVAELVRLSPAGGDVHLRARLLQELWQLHTAALQEQVTDLGEVLGDQYEIASGLLQVAGSDPADLAWLGGTRVRAGMLGLWDGDPAQGRLRVAGAYDPYGELGVVTGTELGVTSFPPRAMIDLARPELREACFVVPVRTADRRWGMLAVVGEVDPSASHSHYHYWAVLLASVLEEHELKRSLRTSEERYAYAASAANDGLWEYEVATERLYASARFQELLGLVSDEASGIEGWFTRIRGDDLGRVRSALRQARDNPGTPLNVEFRTAGPGEARWLLGRALGVAGQDGAAERIVGSLSDIHARKELEQRLRHGALYDEITGLPNRRLFLERLTVAMHRTLRRPGASYAVIFLDLDGFKLVNDSLGHLVGDQLLTVVADRLRSTLRAEDTAARFGGDEFAVLLLDPVPDDLLGVAARIQAEIAAPVMLSGQEVSVGASAGIATSQTGYRDVSDVLRDADTAMYVAKEAERGSASVFDPTMNTRARARLQQRAELRAALAEQQFVVHYQPVVALDGSPLGQFEALVRWAHPERGLLLPGEFLPAMEDMSLVVPLGRRVLDEVCRQIAAWAAEGLDATVAVNLSHQEFWAPDVIDSVRGSLERHGVPPERLHVEITETVVMDDAAAAHAVMGKLRHLGLSLSIDDFGTGQSSLHALRNLPADVLKIDGSFVRRMDEAQTAELVRIIVEIGQVLGLQTTAECVESPEQAELLRSMGCTFGQGWLWSKAVPAEEAAGLLRVAHRQKADGAAL